MSKKGNAHSQDLLKYQKLYNWCRTLITSGVIKNKDKFPSENILQKKFGYSRQTVRTALNQLEEDGLIVRVKGSSSSTFGLLTWIGRSLAILLQKVATAEL